MTSRERTLRMVEHCAWHQGERPVTCSVHPEGFITWYSPAPGGNGGGWHCTTGGHWLYIKDLTLLHGEPAHLVALHA